MNDALIKLFCCSLIRAVVDRLTMYANNDLVYNSFVVNKYFNPQDCKILIGPMQTQHRPK